MRPSSIFATSAAAKLDAATTPAFCCGVGAARASYWDAKAAYDPKGVKKDHQLFHLTEWWATGFVIHERAVVSVAHAPRATSIMGDRILVPERSVNKSLQRILRVKRIIDHPKASHDKGFDVRLMILHYDEAPDNGWQKVVQEIAERKCKLVAPSHEPADLSVHGFRDLHWSPEDSLSFSLRCRGAEWSADQDDEDRHGHSKLHESILTPCRCRVGEKPEPPTAAFGDSGCPIVGRNLAERTDAADKPADRTVVGMYVRRSLNRPALTNPDLVVVRFHPELFNWMGDALSRYDIDLPPLVTFPAPPAQVQEPPTRSATRPRRR